MKRVFKVLLVLIVAMMPFVAVSAKTTTKATTTTTAAANTGGKKVKFYVFHGNGCSHCADLLTYLSELENDPEYNYMYELVKYEVWYNEDNKNLMTKVYKYFGEADETKVGVPLYVIGNEHFSGFPNSSQAEAYNKATTEIKEALKKAYNDEKYVDVVSGIGSGTIDPSDSNENEKDTKKTNNIIGYVIIGIVVIVVIAIIFGRSKADIYYPTEDEDDDDTEEETDEDEEEPVKEEPKKTETKSKSSKSTSKSTTKKTTKTTSTKKTTKKNTKKK